MTDVEYVWRRVAITLMAELADHGYDPNSPAVAAYNLARNGRYHEALDLVGRSSGTTP